MDELINDNINIDDIDTESAKIYAETSKKYCDTAYLYMKTTERLMQQILQEVINSKHYSELSLQYCESTKDYLDKITEFYAADFDTHHLIELMYDKLNDMKNLKEDFEQLAEKLVNKINSLEPDNNIQE